MNAVPLSAIVQGTVSDPVLWVLAAVIGWEHRRPVRSTTAILGSAGAVWGAVRVAVYISIGDNPGTTNAAAIVAVCVASMCGVGLAVREIRWYFAKP